MIKKAEDLGNSYLITPSLLNSWEYIWLCEEYVREGVNDTICYEDKVADARKKAYEQFVDTLNRIPSEPTPAMQLGIEFEEECYKGNTIISPIIKDGAYQIVGKKYVDISNMQFLLYGRLDVLKGGVIYDIKRVARYYPQKYAKSHQHSFYLELFKDAKYFEYLAYDNNDKLHRETYYRDECEDIIEVIKKFIKWLEENDLIEIYKEKWKSLK